MAKQPNPKIITKKHLARLERERIQQRYLIIGFIVVIVLIVGSLLYGFLDQTVLRQIRPVAKVGDVTISSGDFINEVKFNRFRTIQQLQSFTSDSTMIQYFGSYILQIGSSLTSPITLGQTVLDSMVEDVLVEKEAKKRGIELSAEDIDREMEQQFGYFANGTLTPTITNTPFTLVTSTYSPTQQALLGPSATPQPTFTSGPTETALPSPTAAETTTPTPEFTPTITPTPTPYTKELFTKEVGQYLTGATEIDLTREQLRGFIARGLLKTLLYEDLTKDVKTVDEQVWARHILVATEDEAKKVIERLNAGETFAALAQELSNDTSNNQQAGDLGWFARGAMVTEFEDAVFALKIGETSQPVKTENGYHVIQVLGHEERPLSESQIDQAKQKIYADWLAQAKIDTKIETYDRWMDIVPSQPEVPLDIQQIIQQLQTASQPQ